MPAPPPGVERSGNDTPACRSASLHSARPIPATPDRLADGVAGTASASRWSGSTLSTRRRRTYAGRTGPGRVLSQEVHESCGPDDGETMTETTQTATHGVQLTDVAAAKVRTLLEQEGRDDLRLRVAVQPGGCSGLIYQLYFDERVLDGHAEPEPTAKPWRSSSPSKASPSTYRHEKVTTCGRRSTGSPTTSTSRTVCATRSRIRSTSARRASDRARSASTARNEAAAATTAGRLTPPGAHGSSSSGPVGVVRTRARTARTPTPAIPPQSDGSAASTSQWAPTSTCPTLAPASTSRGTPARVVASNAAATGCSVPTSPFACCSAASATSGPMASCQARRSNRPVRSTGTATTSSPCRWTARDGWTCLLYT